MGLKRTLTRIVACFSIFNVVVFTSLYLFSTKYAIPQPARACRMSGCVVISSPNNDGRLGNRIGEYASAVGVANLLGCNNVYIPKKLSDYLVQYFDGISIETTDIIAKCQTPLPTYVTPHWSDDFMNSSDFLRWREFGAGTLVFHAFGFYPQYFANVRSELRDKHFRFKKEYSVNAEMILKKMGRRVKNPVFVGVHVRRTDYVKHFQHLYHDHLVSPKFFHNAIQYFQERYDQTIFAVASDDVKWCRENFPKLTNVLYVEDFGKTGPVYDLAVLAFCNHSIFDHGTYGFLGAFLTKEGGEIVVADSPYPGRPLEEIYHWKLMS